MGSPTSKSKGTSKRVIVGAAVSFIVLVSLFYNSIQIAAPQTDQVQQQLAALQDQLAKQKTNSLTTEQTVVNLLSQTKGQNQKLERVSEQQRGEIESLKTALKKETATTAAAIAAAATAAAKTAPANTQKPLKAAVTSAAAPTSVPVAAGASAAGIAPASASIPTEALRTGSQVPLPAGCGAGMVQPPHPVDETPAPDPPSVPGLLNPWDVPPGNVMMMHPVGVRLCGNPHDLLEQTLELFPPMLNIDVGAYDGRDAVEFASAGGHEVHSFEPTPSKGDAIQGMHDEYNANNKCKGQIHFHRGATGNETKEMTFYVRGGGSEQDSFENNFPGESTEVKVPVMTLDDVVGDREVLYLKTDTEGHDIDSLKGATKLFAKQRVRMVQSEFIPRIMPGGIEQAMAHLELMTKNGYFCFDCNRNQLHDVRIHPGNPQSDLDKFEEIFVKKKVPYMSFRAYAELLWTPTLPMPDLWAGNQMGSGGDVTCMTRHSYVDLVHKLQKAKIDFMSYEHGIDD